MGLAVSRATTGSATPTVVRRGNLAAATAQARSSRAVATSSSAGPATATATARAGRPVVAVRGLLAVGTAVARRAVGVAIHSGARASAVAAAFAGRPLVIHRGGLAGGRALAFRIQDVDLTKVLAVAVADSDRVPTFTLLVDWASTGNYSHPLSDLGPVVESFTVNREITTSQPTEISLVTGTVTTTLTALLSGRWLPPGVWSAAGVPSRRTDPVKAFSPYRTDADLSGIAILGRAIRLATGFLTPQGPVETRRFTGTLAAYSPHSAERSVQITGYDPMDRLRALISQAAWGIDGLLAAVYGGRYRHLMNTQWWIDRIFRANGFFASPPPITSTVDSADLVCSATMHGSVVAERAAITSSPIETFVSTPATAPKPWVVGDHPFGMLAPNPDYLAGAAMSFSWLTGQTLRMEVGTGYTMSGWVRLPAAGSAAASGTSVLWRVSPVERSTSGFTFELRNGVPTMTFTPPNFGTFTFAWPSYVLPATPTWEFVGVWVGITSVPQSRLALYRSGPNQRAGTFGAAPPATPVPNYSPSCPINVSTVVPFTNFSLARRAAEPALSEWIGSSWTPTATVDVGGNDIGGFEELIGQKSLDLLNDIVSAEYGIVGADENGMPFFQSRAVPRTRTVSEVITTERSLADLIVSVDEASVRNWSTVETSRLVLQEWVVIYKAEDPNQFVVAASSSFTIDIAIPANVGATWTALQGATGYVAADWGDLDDDDITASGVLRFALSYANTPTVEVDGSGYTAITIGGRQLSARTMRLIITNGLASPIRFATPDKLNSDGTTTYGAPALKIPGRYVKADPPVTGGLQNTASVGRYGVRAWDMGGPSVWRQDYPSAVALCTAVLSETITAKPVLSEVDVPHNPLRHPLQLVTLQDPDGLGSVTGQITSIRATGSAGDGSRDGLLVRPSTSPLGW